MTEPLTTGAGQWRRIRRLLNEHRQELAAMAAGLYPDLPRVAGTDLLCWPEWRPAAPLDLAELRLDWISAPPRPAADGTGAAAAHVLPRTAAGQAYPAYAAAIEALDRPALFENRVCYRLLDADLTGETRAGPRRLRFGPSRYFEAVNLGQAVAHELTAAWAASGSPPDRPPLDSAALDSAAPDCAALDWAALPLRASVGDPCALPRRSALTAVTTLTLRRAPGGAASFLLHWRDPALVNHAGGLYQVMPAGIFQPVSAAPAARRHDLSLWRCLTREFSEELLGGSEEYPTRAGRLDYGRWPFHRELAAAREAGTLRVSCLGLGVDPLTLATDILTVAVFEADVFDRVFRGLVTENAEGRVVTQDGSAAIPFTQASVDRFTSGGEPVQTAGEALLRLAWQHRDLLGIAG
ncbi:MAG: putative HTH-type transcriptional regulator [Actinomycetia bacterium]|nr:putative HTH-type transcriptional regulator [Actinomycetes bacterium]